MTLEIAAAVKIFAPIAKAVAPSLLNAIQSKLNPSELARALEAGMVAASEQNDKQPADRHLFYKYYPDRVPKFLQEFFEEPGVQQELQKPLINDGMPQAAFLIKALEEFGSRKKVSLVQGGIAPWINTFISTYFEQTSTYLRFQVTKKEYFTKLVRCFDDIRFGGIAVEGQEIDQAAKLVDIFVMPDVQEKKSTYFAPLEQDLPLGFSNRQAQVLWEQKQRSSLTNPFAGQPFLAAKLLDQTQAMRVVVLGAPGSGKTTLVSYFVVMLAQQKPELLGLAADTDWLPILIKIRDLAKDPDLNILKFLRHSVETDLAVQSLPADFFEHWLNSGRALILLDGLDEVAEESRRYKVVERIESFLGSFSSNRAIITSRPAGYKPDFFRADEFPHYEILPFDNDKINEFIDHWYDNRCATKPEAQQRKKGLRKALSENDRIEMLARNPLLLTIIALIHRYQAILPKDRYKLYDKAVDTLLTSWDANKELTNHKVLEYLELDDLRRLMVRLAYWIHTQGGTGDNEGGTQIDRDELITQLSQYIKELKKVDRHCAKAEAERFLDQIVRDRAGLLSKQGRDRYAFVHKTFQEYLTAQEIRDQQEESFDVVLKHIDDHLHDPHWREVLLLLIAQQKRGNPAKALQAILQHPTPYELWLHRNLFFAGNCLAENVPMTDDVLVTDILQQLVGLEASSSSLVSSSIRRQIFKVLCSLSETQFEAQILKLLKDSSTINKLRLQKYRVALGEQYEAIQTLATIFKDNLQNGLESSFDALLIASHSDIGLDLASHLVPYLLPLLKDEDSGVRSSAASALSRSGSDSESIVSHLLPLLRDEDGRVRFNAAFALGSLGSGSASVVPYLVPLLQDEDSEMRSSAAVTLSIIGIGLELVPHLVPLLQDEDGEVRSSAAFALSSLDRNSESVPHLLPLLQDEDSGVRSSAAYALGRSGSGPELVSHLLPLLQDEDKDVRSRAASALSSLSNGSELVSHLLPLLQDEDSRVRSHAASALGRSGSGPELVSHLLPLLQDEDRDVRSSAASALGSLGNNSNFVTLALAEWIEQHQELEHIGDGVDALWNIVTGRNSGDFRV